MKGRWKVACINWGHPTAPHALAYLMTPSGAFGGGKYFATHAEAITYANKQARRTA
ncbi:hypothetical protein [Arthrobacter sp. Z1-15]